MSHRLFLALRPPAHVRARLALVQCGVASARWQTDAQLHLTLRFLGEVERPVAEDVASMLVSLHGHALSLRVSGVGHFGRRDRMDALWAGVAPHDEVTALHHKLDRLLLRAGLVSDPRAFLPHITLARFAASTRATVAEGWLADHAALSSEAFSCDAVILYESLLGRDGAVYREVERFPLG